MNADGQSREDASSRIREDLNTTKTKIRLGYWNARTMCQTGKLAQVTSEMRRFNLHVLGVSESKCTGFGRMRTTTRETVLYSGREDDQHYEGVATIFVRVGGLLLWN